MLRRLLQVIPTLFVVYTVLFGLSYLMPGDPVRATLGEEYNRLDPETIAAIEEELGLNRPFMVQYLEFVGRMLRLDLGESYVQRIPVQEIIGYRLPRTLQLMMGGILVSLAIGIPAGVIAALKQYSWIDHTVTVVALIGLSMPVFWQGLLAQLFFTQDKYGIALFPVAGYGDGNPIYMILPSIVLGTSLSAIIARITRTAMLEVANQEYLKTARSKGLKSRSVLLKHQLRNALVPVITVVGLQIAGLLTGSILTETIFNWPGLGRAIVPAINTRDTPVILGIVVYGALIYIFVNLLTDVIYALIDPRIRFGDNG